MQRCTGLRSAGHVLRGSRTHQAGPSSARRGRSARRGGVGTDRRARRIGVGCPSGRRAAPELASRRTPQPDQDEGERRRRRSERRCGPRLQPSLGHPSPNASDRAPRCSGQRLSSGGRWRRRGRNGDDCIRSTSSPASSSITKRAPGSPSRAVLDPHPAAVHPDVLVDERQPEPGAVAPARRRRRRRGRTARTPIAARRRGTPGRDPRRRSGRGRPARRRSSASAIATSGSPPPWMRALSMRLAIDPRQAAPVAADRAPARRARSP